MSDQLEIGSEFAGYRVDSLLGQGGFSSVYLAEDLRPAIRRRVAVKVLNPRLAADPKNRERFHRESLLAVQLDDHPNIVTVLDAGESDGRFYIVQRYIEGQDLAMMLEESGRIDPARVADIIRQVASALDAAHTEGLVHRDVKPGNILLATNRDRVYLADFGLTKRTASDDSLTGAGEFLGTFSYAAPEQLGNDPVDGQADQYALGCVLYECLTGDPPFTGDLQAVIAAHVTREPPSASEQNPQLPKEIDAVIARALAKEPNARFPTCGEFATAADAALRPHGTTLPPGSAAAAAAAAAGAAAAGAARNVPPPPTAPPGPPRTTRRRRRRSGGKAPAAPAGPPTPPPGQAPPPAARATPPPAGPPTPPPGQARPPAGPPTPPPGQTPPPAADATLAPAARSTPPGGPPTPPSQVPAPAKRSRVPVLPLVLVGIGLVAIVVAVVLLMGGDDGGGGGGGGGGDPESAADELLDAVPASIRDDCEAQEDSGDTVASAECDLTVPDSGPGADGASFTQYESVEDLDDAFDAEVDDAPENLAPDLDCNSFRNAVHEWSEEASQDEPTGRVACIFDSAPEESRIVWTDTGELVLGEAERPDEFDADLYTWWAEGVGRFDPNPFPNADESELLDHVPEALRDSCGRANSAFVDATVAVSCVAPDVDLVIYSQFADSDTAGAQFGSLRDTSGVERDSGNPTTGACPAEGTYTQGDDVTRGRVVCYTDSDNSARYAWVDVELAIIVEALGPLGGGARDFPALQGFFAGSDSGPV